MSATANYEEALLDAMAPELARRLEKTAELEGKALGEVINDFLQRGANTPLFLGVGANTEGGELNGKAVA